MALFRICCLAVTLTMVTSQVPPGYSDYRENMMYMMWDPHYPLELAHDYCWPATPESCDWKKGSSCVNSQNIYQCACPPDTADVGFMCAKVCSDDTSCSYGQVCRYDIFGRSLCMPGCPDNQYLDIDSSICMPKGLAGEYCERDHQCLTEACFQKQCICPPPLTFFDEQTKQCLNVTRLSLDDDCTVENTVCSPGLNCIEGKCSCDMEHVRIDGACINMEDPQFSDYYEINVLNTEPDIKDAVFLNQMMDDTSQLPMSLLTRLPITGSVTVQVKVPPAGNLIFENIFENPAQGTEMFIDLQSQLLASKGQIPCGSGHGSITIVDGSKTMEIIGAVVVRCDLREIDVNITMDTTPMFHNMNISMNIFSELGLASSKIRLNNLHPTSDVPPTFPSTPRTITVILEKAYSYYGVSHAWEVLGVLKTTQGIPASSYIEIPLDKPMFVPELTFAGDARLVFVYDQLASDMDMNRNNNQLEFYIYVNHGYRPRMPCSMISNPFSSNFDAWGSIVREFGKDSIYSHNVLETGKWEDKSNDTILMHGLRVIKAMEKLYNDSPLNEKTCHNIFEWKSKGLFEKASFNLDPLPDLILDPILEHSLQNLMNDTLVNIGMSIMKAIKEIQSNPQTLDNTRRMAQLHSFYNLVVIASGRKSFSHHKDLSLCPALASLVKTVFSSPVDVSNLTYINEYLNVFFHVADLDNDDNLVLARNIFKNVSAFLANVSIENEMLLPLRGCMSRLSPTNSYLFSKVTECDMSSAVYPIDREDACAATRLSAYLQKNNIGQVYLQDLRQHFMQEMSAMPAEVSCQNPHPLTPSNVFPAFWKVHEDGKIVKGIMTTSDLSVTWKQIGVCTCSSSTCVAK